MSPFRILIYPFMAACAAVAVGACGSDGTDRPAAATSSLDAAVTNEEGSQPADAGSDGASEDGSVACPDLALGGSLVQGAYVVGTPPDETGGALVPGTYDLTALEVYLGTPGDDGPDSAPAVDTMDSAQATFVLTASTIVTAKTFTALGVLTPLAVSQANVSTESVVELVTAETCPATHTQKTPFTASGNTISLHTAQTWREIYTRRP